MRRGEFVSKVKETGIDIRPFVADQVRRYIEDHPKAKDSEFSATGYVLNKVMQACDHVDRRKMLAEFERSLSDDGRVSDYFENIVKSWGRMDDPGRRGKPRLAEDTFLWFFRHVEDTSYFTEVARHIWPNTSEIFMRFVYAKCGGRDDSDSKLAAVRFKADIEEIKREFRNLWIQEAPRAPMMPPPYVTKKHIKAAIDRDTDDGIWLNPHNHHSIPLSGRKDEQRRLTEFMEDSRPFLICPLIAQSGAGKTRLVSEWMRPYVWTVSPTEWDAGFMTSSDPEARNSDHWKARDDGGKWDITRDTLIVIDYTFAFDDVVRQIATRAREQENYKIRLVVIDHIFPKVLHTDFFWRSTMREKSLVDVLRGKELLDPIELVGTGSDKDLLGDVIAAVASSNERKYLSKNPEIKKAVANLIGMSGGEGVGSCNTVRQPLFAALMGHAIRHNRDYSNWTRQHLIEYFFEKNWRLPWKVWSASNPYKSKGDRNTKHGRAVAAMICAATLKGGLSIGLIEEMLPGEDIDAIIQFANRIISSDDKNLIKPFEPDILGENFLVQYLFYLKNKQRALQKMISLISVSKDHVDAEKAALNFVQTLDRLTRNLSGDNQTLDVVRRSWAVLPLLLDCRKFKKKTLIRKAVAFSSARLASKLLELSVSDEITQMSVREDFKLIAIDLIKNIDVNEFATVSSAKMQEVCAETSLLLLESLNKHPHLDNNFADNLSRMIPEILTIFTESSQQIRTGYMLCAIHNLSTMVPLLANSTNECIDDEDIYGMTAMMLAARYGHLDAAKALCQFNANINSTSKVSGITALIVCSIVGDMRFSAYLLSKDAFPDKKGNEYPSTALIQASVGNSPEIVSDLLIAGADPNLAGTFGQVTALMLASSFGNTRVVEHLCSDNRTSISQADMFGKTALMYASEESHLTITSILHQKLASCRNGELEFQINDVLFDGSQDFFYPIMKGSWKYATEHKCVELLEKIALSGVRELLDRGVVMGIRSCEIPFYNDAVIYEIILFKDDNEPLGLPKGVAVFVIEQGEKFYYYNGTLQQVRIINDLCGVNIDEKTAVPYFGLAAFPYSDFSSLVKFTSYPDDLTFNSQQSFELFSMETDLVGPTVSAVDDVGVIVLGTVLLGDSIQPATVRVNYDGEIEFFLRKPIASKLPILKEVFHRGYRFFHE